MWNREIRLRPTTNFARRRGTSERERERNMRTYRFTSGASLPPRLLISRLMGYLRTIFRFE